MVVRNAGIDWESPDNCYWQHKVARKEAARIVLHGQSEFEASHVVLEGNQDFEVSPRPLDAESNVHCETAGESCKDCPTDTSQVLPVSHSSPLWQVGYQPGIPTL